MSGLAGAAVNRYVDEWIVGLTDITDTVRTAGAHVAAGRLAEATALLPAERPYPLPDSLAGIVGADVD